MIANVVRCDEAQPAVGLGGVPRRQGEAPALAEATPTKPDSELIGEALAAGRVRRVPAGIFGHAGSEGTAACTLSHAIGLNEKGPGGNAGASFMSRGNESLRTRAGCAGAS